MSIATGEFSQRDPKKQFKQWLQLKELRDKALECVAKLDSSRAEDAETLKETAISLCAIDRLLGNDSDNKKEIDENEATSQSQMGQAKKPASTVQKPMKSVWMKWAMDHHRFENVRLSDSDMDAFSGAVKEFVDTEKTANGNVYTLPSLKYSYPALPKPKEKTKPLTNDQKLQNGIFLRYARKVWKEAKEELHERLMVSARGGGDRRRSSGPSSDKDGGDGESKFSAATGGGSIGGGKGEYAKLYDISLRRLRDWVEEDEDKRVEEEKQKKQEKMLEAKISHEQFIKQKDSVRIRIPDDMEALPTASMGYGRAMSGVRPQGGAGGASTTVELMAGSGLKYVHATGKGKMAEIDLAKSRKKLLTMGLVCKENFDPAADPDDPFSLAQYQKELLENPAILEKKNQEQKVREDSARAFESWISMKDMREQAQKYLSFIASPLSTGTAFSGGGGNLRASAHSHSVASFGAGGSYAQALRISGGSLARASAAFVAEDVDYTFCVKVGQALKKVDRTLLPDWTAWCAGAISAPIASVLWDAFEPKACDVHNLASSQLREAFLKILRPGLDFRQTFSDFAEKRQSRRAIEAKEEFALSKKDMGDLLLQMGIAMKPVELASLIDAFDANGDGTVTMTEFLDFTGPKRDKKGGASLVLNQRCSWNTTCPVTGMAHGFTVSNATRRVAKYGWGEEKAESKVNDSVVSAAAAEKSVAVGQSISSAAGAVVGKVVLKTLKNGEQRMMIESAERPKREEILRKFGILSAARLDEKRQQDSKADDGDGYDEEFEDHEPENIGRELNASADGKKNASKYLSGSRCAFIGWTDDDRRDGLKFLATVTKEARQEATLKTLMSEGSPPQVPKFWITSAASSGKGSRYNGFDPTTELEVNWAPANKEDLISFFSIEFAGPAVGPVKGEKYREVYRDPADAGDSDFALFYRVKNLSPGVSYAFRIRGYNGFGPGEYQYKIFTTMPAPPATPRIIRTASDSVTLRWVFSASFFKQLAELKRLFTLADSDGSGNINREEMLAIFDEKVGSHPELSTFVNRVANSVGLDVSQGYASLFDKIEQDDNGVVSWAEFETFFMAAGWTSQQGGGGGNSVDDVMRQSTASAASLRRSADANYSTTTSAAVADLTFVVENCLSELTDTFQNVLKTGAGEGTISRLEPGKSYRFRVYAINVDGVAGQPSETVAVHTMLETPAPPLCSVKNIEPHKVTLTWKGRNSHLTSRHKDVVSRMITDWAGTHAESDSGVSAELAFAKYDKDRSGTIDSAELACVLEDLGTAVTEEKLQAAFAELDANGDGTITFDEFSRWWRKDDVTYVLKRSEAVYPKPAARIIGGGVGGVPESGQSVASRTASVRSISRGRPSSAAHPNTNSSLSGIPEERSLFDSVAGSRKSSVPVPGSATGRSATSGIGPGVRATVAERQVAVPIVSYRGDSTKCSVAGLEPNRLYYFKLRYMGSRSTSQLSPPLVLMTTPLPLADVPALLTLGSTTVRVKWYPPLYGAFKFLVQLKVTASASGIRNSNSGGEDGWIDVYNGPDTLWTGTTMTPDSHHMLRVLCLNCQGNSSEPSPVLTFTTKARLGASSALQGPGGHPSGVSLAGSLMLNPKNSDAFFTIECSGDICVGDTILFTERLFDKSKKGSAAELDPSAGNFDAQKDKRSLFEGRAAKFPGLSSVMSGSIRGMKNPSVVSSASAAVGGAVPADLDKELGIGLDSSGEGAFIGERTIAGRVVKDNYRTLRDTHPSIATLSSDDSGAAVRAISRASKARNLWIEVVWQRSDYEACKPFELKAGVIIQRTQANLEHFEVYRSPWVQEEKRRHLWQEWPTLTDCFIQTDC